MHNLNNEVLLGTCEICLLKWLHAWNQVVTLLENQLRNVQQEMEAVQASLNEDQIQEEGSDITNQGHDLQRAVGARRMHGTDVHFLSIPMYDLWLFMC